ncbi:metallophosphoesterase [Pseudodesulfovibrio sediminis]|uniref:Metallophosphoesterase n=2 Tax=Pseudodesulfovibrio sediminis TaxID=2810563 RepID=A0ABM7P6W5_9BACT|nr:metallophosphoesterase [Pseudodesulfovibrio sediminis]
MLAAGAALVPYGFHATYALEVTRRTIGLRALPTPFAGYTICHLTDLHLAEFGHKQSDLLAIIREGRPDIVVMTGDMVNGKERREEPFLTLCDQLPGIAPTYYVTGNHDTNSLHRGIEGRLEQRGVHVLDNRHVTLAREDASMALAGVGEWGRFGAAGLDAGLRGIPEGETVVLLAHHPEQIAHYVSRGVDLVLSGHTHGGQVRLPFVGSLIAPNQGVFPKYSEGLYRVDDTAMYISRGLGLSVMPFRFNCPREVAFLTLQPRS